MESGEDHPHRRPAGSLDVLVLTVSDTRGLDDDPSGDLLEGALREMGHSVYRAAVHDERDKIRSAVAEGLDRDAVVTTGGTGISPRDVTVEALRPEFDREIEGFSTVFAIMSYEEVSTRAVMSRATAGVVDGVPVFCLPGSVGAVETGAEILREEMDHVVNHLR